MSTEKKRKRVSLKELKDALRIYKFIGPYKQYFIPGIFCLIISSAVTLAFPMLLKQMMSSENNDQANQLALALFGLFAIGGVVSFLRIYWFTISTERALAKLKRDVFSKALHLKMEYFNSHRVGEITSRIQSDIATLQGALTTTSAEFVRQTLMAIGSIVVLFVTAPKLTGFMLLLVPVMALVGVFFGRFIRKISKAMQDKIAASNVIAEETLHGIVSVKSYANESFEIDRFSSKINDVVDLAMKRAKYRGGLVSFIMFCLFGSIVAVIWFAITRIGMNANELLMFLIFTGFIGAAFGSLPDLMTQLVSATGATDRIEELLSETTEDSAQGSHHGLIKGRITFDHIAFAYPSRPDIPVIKEFSLNVEPGQQIALVGPSGTGKSTLINLVLQFYRPTDGAIKVDGVAIDQWNLADFRKQIALVPQEVMLFGGTIRENIAYGNLEATEAEIIEAAKQANAHDFIVSFPEGYDTIVGDRGIQLSGGQRQRVAIARAVLKNPAILLLDEATSALDSESELLVQNALEKLMNGRTSIVIAHRLSTIQKADQIIVMDEGKIAEQGSHESLMISNGLYARLIEMQELNSQFIG